MVVGGWGRKRRRRVVKCRRREGGVCVGGMVVKWEGREGGMGVGEVGCQEGRGGKVGRNESVMKMVKNSHVTRIQSLSLSLN